MYRRVSPLLMLLLAFAFSSCKEAAITAPEPEEPGIGSGTWRVGSEVVPGRYYTNPTSGCYFERLSGFSGSLDDLIANEFVGFDAGQWIVDISSSDVGFSTDSQCGRWRLERQIGLRASIAPGVWEVGSQITPGRYRTNASEGCYWERLSAFGADLASINANDYLSHAGQQIVDILPSDVGFESDEECGTWERI